MIKGSFEARKVSYRQTKDGVVIAFVIHPNDPHTELAIAPLGIRLMIGYAEIGDDETTPTATDSVETPVRVEPAAYVHPNANGVNGINNPKSADRSERAKAQYASMTPEEQAVARAARLCKEDAQFQAWICEANEAWPVNEETAARELRDLTGVKSRSEYAWNKVAYDKFRAIETEYLMATGRMAEAR